MTEHKLVCEESGVRLDKFIADADIGVSRSAAVGLIESGDVFLNGNTANKKQKLKTGDEVTVIGDGSDNTISFDDIAQLTGTINYELVCLVGKRVPRVYMRHGKSVGARFGTRHRRGLSEILEGEAQGRADGAGAAVTRRRDAGRGRELDMAS